MPRQTFFNLPEDKRNLIIDLALDEFSNYDYKNASISRIVNRAGIAKGSLYQYFEDKRDLYLYLVEISGQAKMEYLRSSRPVDSNMDFYTHLRWLFSAGIRFGLENPRLSQVGYRMLNSENPVRSENFKNLNQTALVFYKDLVTNGQQRGDINPGLDLGLCALILSAMLTHLSQDLIEHANLDPIVAEEHGLSHGNWQAVEAQFSQIVAILEHGLRQEQIPKTQASEGL